jgi:phosphoserine phosphatase
MEGNMPWKFNQILPELPPQSLDTRVILVRHGESTFNAQAQYQGSSDESVLTESGRQAAQQTGNFFSELQIDALYTSSLKRAKKTASQILGAMFPTVPHLPPNQVYISSQLREIDLPAWQGLAHQFVQENFAADYCCWKQRPQEFKMASPEGICFPVLDVYDRAQQFWQTVISRHVGQTVLIVSHAGMNRALISTALGLSPAYYHALQQSNCGVSVLKFSQGNWQNAQLEALNLTMHLGANLPKPKGGERGVRLLLLPSTIHPYQVQQVTVFLKDIPIQLSLSGACPESHAIAEQILQPHLEAVHLQVLGEDFSELWQQAIMARQVEHDGCDRLMTGLVIAPEQPLTPCNYNLEQSAFFTMRRQRSHPYSKP